MWLEIWALFVVYLLLQVILIKVWQSSPKNGGTLRITKSSVPKRESGWRTHAKFFSKWGKIFNPNIYPLRLRLIWWLSTLEYFTKLLMNDSQKWLIYRLDFRVKEVCMNFECAVAVEKNKPYSYFLFLEKISERVRFSLYWPKKYDQYFNWKLLNYIRVNNELRFESWFTKDTFQWKFSQNFTDFFRIVL